MPSPFTRNVILLSFVSLLADVASEMLYPVVPGYLKSIGFSVALIGVLEGTAELVAGVSKTLFGVWSDRSQRRALFVRAGYFLGAVSKPLMAVFANTAWVFGVRTMDRLGKGMRTAPRDALLSLETTPQTKARVFGFHRGMDTVGAVVGPLLALLLVHSYLIDLRTLFVLAVIPGLLSVALTFLIRDPVPNVPSVKTASTSNRIPLSLATLRYWSVAPSAFRQALRPILLFALFNSSDMFLLLYVTEHHGGTTNALLVYIVYNCSLALSAFPLGWISDRTSLQPVLASGAFIVGCVYGLVTWATSFNSVLILFVAYGIGVAAFESTSKAWVSSVVPKNEMGSAMGFLAGTQSIALLVASSVAGIVWSIGPVIAFTLTCIMAMASALWLAGLRTSNRV